MVAGARRQEAGGGRQGIVRLRTADCLLPPADCAQTWRPLLAGACAMQAREAISAINPLPVETLAELTRHTLEGLVESEQDLLNVMVKPLHPAPKAHAAPEHPTPRRSAGHP